MVTDPSTPTTVYVATDAGGVFKSIDGGQTWSATGAGLPATWVPTLTISRSNPSILYAGTEYDGVFKTLDGGATWVATATNPLDVSPNGSVRLPHILAVAVDPQDSNTVYAIGEGSDTPMYKTTNGGTTWSTSSIGITPAAAVTHLLVEPLTGAVYAFGGLGIYKSTDGGGFWIPVGLIGSPADFSGRPPTFGLTVDPANAQVLYAVGWFGFVKSSDGGASWTSPVTFGNDIVGEAIAIDPHDSNILYMSADCASPATPCGIGNVFKSSDRGSSWTSIRIGHGGRFVQSLAALATTPTTLVAGFVCSQYGGGTPDDASCDGAVYRSQDAGTTWSASSTGITALYIRGIAVDPSNPLTLYAATSSGVFKTTDGGATWMATNTGLTQLDANAIAVAPSSPNVLYVSIQGSTVGAYRSADGGATWAPAATGLLRVFGDPAVPVMFAVDPSNAQIVYAGTNAGLFKTPDGGAHWAQITVGNNPSYFVRIKPGLPSTLYFTALNQFGNLGVVTYKSTDGGITATPLGLGGVAAMAFDSMHPSTMYASTVNSSSPGGCTVQSGMFKTTDNGATWTVATNGLPCGFVSKGLEVDPLNPSIVYTGLYRNGRPGLAGVYMTADGGASWTPLGSPPATDVITMAVAATSATTLYAGTNGASIEAIVPAPPSITSVTPSTGSGSGGTLVTITGSGFAGGATVTFGGSSATVVTVASSTQIIATTSAHASGNVDVIVTNTDGVSAARASGFTFSVPCTVQISSGPTTFGPLGGIGTIDVVAGIGCAWTATVSAPFLTITAGGSGSGNGSVSFAVGATTVSRSGKITIGGHDFAINQTGSCSFALSATSASVGAAAAVGAVTVTAATGCAWTSTSNAAFLSITSGGSETGTATVGYAVSINAATSQRTGTLTIAGQTLTVTQAGASGAVPSIALDRRSLIFTAVTTGAAFSSQTGSQAVRLTQTGAGTVTWTAASSSPWLVVSPTSGSGSATLTVSVQFAAGLAASQGGNVMVTFTGAGNTAGPVAVTLKTVTSNASTSPTGSFDTPTDGSTGVTGSIAVTGWAVDDVEVTRVRILRAPVAGEPAGALVFLGDAVQVDGARPDVQGSYPTLPRSARAGWGYLLLTNFLPGLGNGTFKLYAIADDADGHSTTLGSKTITCTNSTATAPFGAIDTPGQGEVVTTASLNNFGWVLSPGSRRSDPPHGGTVQVVIDGALGVTPSGWVDRSDLTALFPVAQYSGIANALGVATLDMTALTNGVHTLAWLVTDSLGSASGVGSRYFTVSNGSLMLDPAQARVPTSGGSTVISGPTMRSLPPAAAPRLASVTALATEVNAAPGDGAPLRGRRGYNLDTPLQSYVVRDAVAMVDAEELDRIELHLAGIEGAEGVDTTVTGYLRVPDGLAPLPIGSALNASTGAFTWQPGVAFVGPYHFVFVRWVGGRAVGRQEVRVVLHPQGSSRVGPQTVIDVPTAAAGAAGVGDAFVVAGWAADLDAQANAGVDTVHVWAYRVNAAGPDDDPIWIGAAAYGGARPDVAAVYGERFLHTGYGIRAQGLAPGTYDLAVFAWSTARAEFLPAKTVRITVR